MVHSSMYLGRTYCRHIRREEKQNDKYSESSLKKPRFQSKDEVCEAEQGVVLYVTANANLFYHISCYSDLRNEISIF